MATPKKINPNAQAPELIRKAKRLGWTQQKLATYLYLRQPTVSNYAIGRIDREQHWVIKKLEEIIAKKLTPPDPMSDNREANRTAAIEAKALNSQENLPKKRARERVIM